MHIGILASSESWYFRDLARAATPLGMQATRLDFERMVTHVTSQKVVLQFGERPLDELDAAGFAGASGISAEPYLAGCRRGNTCR